MEKDRGGSRREREIETGTERDREVEKFSKFCFYCMLLM